MRALSERLKSQGWCPGFPNYTGASWHGFKVAYFMGVAWHRKEQ